jgi:hypothetical protein
MSAFSPARRAAVSRRANDRCEYCHLPTRGQVATFPIDHVNPRSEGGSHDIENLALACPHCNSRKWIAIDAVDAETGETVPLFNPRRDVWNEHFEWETLALKLTGRTPVGRATIDCLRINDPDMIALREILAELGFWIADG